ncbi:MAG: Asp-tRNA(Asn)/Glu-tRNA(Gln) amidotransferase subunit GatC [Clostridiales bacterium]|jgi:aspartyl-tRNA(Asn)/glutamyl-tRNA(Gln) amidotransferase subunit C|nr:Asp-tRNA(Asn)/Glu-tRNA(Gln) amidotransferase subunit GatC [Clostridiales bacterium]
MKIDKEKFFRLADLVKLKLTKEEESRLIKDLNKLVEFIDTMDEQYTDDTEPMAYIHTLKNVCREDNVVESRTGQELLADVTDSKDGCFVVPRIME